MKIFLEQFLVLGGFYFVISYLFNFFTTDLFEILNRLLTICLVITVIVLFFKKSFRFLDSFCKNHSKITLYLMTLGFVEYLGVIILGIPGGVYGYNAARAQYKGEEYVSSIPQYLDYAVLFYLAILVIALLWATYVIFIKNRKAHHH